MPSPIGHSLSGLFVYFLFNRKRFSNWMVLALLLFMANLPDLDFLLGFIKGNPNAYHHQFMHSLIFVVAVALIIAFAFNKLLTQGRYFLSFIWLCIPGFTHLFLDALSRDTSAPYGMQLLWPFSKEYFMFPFTIFADIQRSSENSTFISSLFSLHNFEALLVEIVVLTPVVILAFLKFRKPKICDVS